MENIKKRSFLQDVLILANIIELTNRASLKTSPKVLSSDDVEEIKYSPALVKWETFSNISKEIKE